jgi:quercetin dioxygenase-like cupin family protein
MQTRRPILNLFLALFCWLIPQNSPASSSGPSLDARTRVVFSHALPALDPSHMQVTTVEVTYPPGGSSSPHSHPCPVIGYVLKGAVRMQVKGGTEAVYRAGDSFYEEPNGIHMVSKNASTTEPATFLAYFICDHTGPLSVKVGTDSSQGTSHPETRHP